MKTNYKDENWIDNDTAIEEWIASYGNDVIWDEDIQYPYISNNEYLAKNMDDKSLKIHILERLDKLELSIKSLEK